MGLNSAHHDALPTLPTGAGLSASTLPAKSLMGMPWRLAFALQDWGWILRSEIIWHRPNPMPESVKDRPTRAHSTIFLFSKQPRYWYDALAIAEPVTGNAHARGDGVNPKARAVPAGWNTGPGRHDTIAGRYPGPKQDALGDRTKVGFNARYKASRQNPSFSAAVRDLVETRNARSVWTLPTQPYTSGSDDVDHFATFPEALVERMLLASTAPRACPACAVPWRRVMERTPGTPESFNGSTFTRGKTAVNGGGRASQRPRGGRKEAGWEPACRCPDNDGGGKSIVLDPFGGSGTVAKVATKHGRDAVLIDLNPRYEQLMDDRVSGVQLSLESLA